MLSPISAQLPSSSDHLKLAIFERREEGRERISELVMRRAPCNIVVLEGTDGDMQLVEALNAGGRTVHLRGDSGEVSVGSSVPSLLEKTSAEQLVHLQWDLIISPDDMNRGVRFACALAQDNGVNGVHGNFSQQQRLRTDHFPVVLNSTLLAHSGAGGVIEAIGSSSMEPSTLPCTESAKINIW